MSNQIVTSISDFKLRLAVEDDIPLILHFIKSLAEYEKLSRQVTANEGFLMSNLFGDNPHAEVLIAENKSEPVGFALFFHNFSTFLGKPGLYLEDVYIKPEFRKKGFGTHILQFLAKLAVERGCGRFEWSVLDWNEPAIQFYESLAAKPQDEWTTYRLTGKALKILAGGDQ
jgi:GNAT superfamily N-acetyltransferase